MAESPGARWVAWLEDLDAEDVPRVGGKNAALGEMIRSLSERGIRVPQGFATTAEAYRRTLEQAGIEKTIAERIDRLHRGKASLAKVGEAIRKAFLEAELPEEVSAAVRRAYRDLAARTGREDPDVAARSSATAEDLPEASFAGQQESYLNVRGADALLDACRRCYASLFTDRFVPDSVLVTTMTDPDWVPIMKRAAAIVTDHGGRTSHAAIVSRELGVPAVVGTGDATEVLRDEREVTVSCAEGEEGHVYDGVADVEVEELALSDLPETRTRVMINLASPAAAFRRARLPADGVGLARMEFIVNNAIKVHPMALVRFDELAFAAGSLGLRPALHAMGLALAHAGRLRKHGA